MKNLGAQFLHERDPNLQKSVEVGAVVDFLNQNGEKIPNNPEARKEAHLGFLANKDYVSDGILTGNEASIERQVNTHAIKAEDIPESYFELQLRIAREQGMGDISISPEMRNKAQRIISADQRHSLNSWAEYLSGNDAGYPDWFKTYAFDGILKMGKFDKKKQEFQKRSNFTTVPFPELSRGALSQVHSWVKESFIDQEVLADMFENAQEEEAFQRALKTGNFAKLYVHAIHKTQEGMITPEQQAEVKGSWKRYVQDSDPSVLHGDLQGFGLDWCTATGMETAKTHIKGGDFYVYYTHNEDGKETVPRVAIRMENGVVAEVRGINASQELELSMADTTAEQLQGLPGGEEYIAKAEDMKRLTAIDKKITANAEVELTSEELNFLYELYHQIQGFGYDADPRIAEIRAKRGERDKPELTKLVPESIRGQMRASFAAYKTVTEQLGGAEQRRFRRLSEAGASQQEFEQMFASKDKEWQQSGVYEEIVERLVTDGVRFNLLATPDIEASEAQIVALAEAFGKDQRNSTYVYDEMYRKNRFSARQLSGNTGKSPVKFSLIEANLDPRLASKTGAQQREVLAQLQVDGPRLNVRIPSLLDAITNWYVLRARGDKLAGNAAFNKTFVRHFDLPEQQIVDWSVLPFSCVHDADAPYLDSSDAEDQRGGRVSVG